MGSPFYFNEFKADLASDLTIRLNTRAGNTYFGIHNMASIET
jgi:hypothetical protein